MRTHLPPVLTLTLTLPLPLNPNQVRAFLRYIRNANGLEDGA